MKLSLNKDLEPLKSKAKNLQRMISVSQTERHIGGIYPIKLRDAQAFLSGQPASDLLNQEAKMKSVSVEDLCHQVVARSADAEIKVRAIETERQLLNRQIDAATSEQELLQFMRREFE